MYLSNRLFYSVQIINTTNKLIKIAKINAEHCKDGNSSVTMMKYIFIIIYHLKNHIRAIAVFWVLHCVEARKIKNQC